MPFLSAPDKEPVRREEPKAAAKESVSEGGSKAPFEAATVEITEKDYESDLEKYERLREKTLKKQKEDGDVLYRYRTGGYEERKRLYKLRKQKPCDLP